MAGTRPTALLRPSIILLVICPSIWFSQTVYPTSVKQKCSEQATHCKPENCSSYLPGELSPFGYVLPPSRRQNCQCDAQCSLYNDCCIDYWDHCVNETDPPVTSFKYSPFLECVTPMASLKGVHISYFTVAGCPPDWPQDDIREYCENQTLAMSQKLLTLPVNGPEEIVFKNVFCTICHRIPPSQLFPWSVMLWNCGDPHSPQTCSSFDLNQPPSINGDSAHRCYKDFVHTCPNSTTESLSTFCQNHTSLVFDNARGLVYKNQYCSTCNGVSSLSLQCKATQEQLPDYPYSLFLLFDFTKRRVVFDGESIGNCSQRQIYDPFQGECRYLGCPDGMTLLSGRCVEPLSHHRWPTETHNFTDDCFQHLESSGGIANDARDNLTTLVKVCQQSGTTSEQIYVIVHFAEAKRVEYALNSLMEDISLSGATSHPCNSTTVTLVATSQPEAESNFPICQGFTLNGVQLDDIDLNNDLYVTDDGYVYSGVDFMHVTHYALSGNISSSSKETSIVLCDPLVVKSCPVLSFKRSEFLVQKSGGDDVFVHAASGQTIQADNVWQLPGGSLRVCDFLSLIETHPAWMMILSDFSIAGSVISIVFLTLSFGTYVFFPSLRNQPGKIIMNLMVASIMGQAFLLMGNVVTQWLCVVRATILHFSWLATFSWMSVLACDLALSIRSKTVPRQHDEHNSCKVLKLSLLGWVIPAVFVSICFFSSKLADESRSWVWLQYGGRTCWIVNPLHSLFVFGIPLALLLIYVVLANRKRLVALQMARSAKNDLLLCSKLVIVTGVTWSLFLAANLTNSVGMWYIATLVNSLQGAIISLMFLLKSSVRRMWRQ